MKNKTHHVTKFTSIRISYTSTCIYTMKPSPHNKEFIYREKLHTKLNEITSRITNIYKKAILVQNLAAMDKKIKANSTSSKQAKDFIFITFVEIYKETNNLEVHSEVLVEDYDKSTFSDRFFYSSPFLINQSDSEKVNSESAKSETTSNSSSSNSTTSSNTSASSSNILNVAKKKFILTTEEEFPSMQKRIKIIKTEEILISPVEMAIDDLLKKVHQIEKHVRNVSEILETTTTTNNSSADILRNYGKTLQLVLGGAVSPTVHSGPLEFANVILKPNLVIYKNLVESAFSQNINPNQNGNTATNPNSGSGLSNSNFPPSLLNISKFTNRPNVILDAGYDINEASILNDYTHLNKLKLCLKRFLYVCESGIRINAKIIDKAQENYQKQLEKDYGILKSYLSEIMVC